MLKCPEMQKKAKQKEIVIFKGSKGLVKLRGDFHNETLWATQAEIANVFGADRSVITKHIRNIFKDGELQKDSVCAKFAHTANDGKTYQVQAYNLDIILSVGYRANSKVAIEFRKWATTTLRQHITAGFTINRSRISQNYDAFMEAVDKTRSLLPAQSDIEARTVLELIQLFADTWFSLDAYDKEALLPNKVNKKRVKITASEFLASVEILKTELMRKGEASDNFARERNRDSVEGIVGNVMQSFGGKAVYPSVEDKAAHLLYFIIKNHPFVDGNKRSGAYAFVWFLEKARVLDTNRLTPAALTVLTLLIAESDPKDKEKMVDLVVMLIAGPKNTSHTVL